MRRAGRKAGFTLIEIVATVAIFALLFALIAPRVGSITSRTLNLRADALADRLELARERAVVTGKRHRLLLDLDAGAYRLEWWVTPAEQQGREPEPPAPLDLRGNAPIPMAPRTGERPRYHPIPGVLGHFEWLEQDVFFGGVETPEGWFERGETFVEFESDGTATDTVLFLDDASGRSLALDVLPLADFVRVRDAQG